MRERKKLLISCAVAAVVVLVLGGVVFAMNRSDDDKNVAGAAESTTTTKPKAKIVPVAPLTGLPDPTGAARGRSVVTVKIDNTQNGWPKYNVDQADVVYEEVVEGGITRLAVMFNSTAPEQVGPVRSVRRTDQSIVWPVGGVFAYSGGAPYAIESINTAPVVQLDESRAGDDMFRDHSRGAPWNLYARVDKMYARGGTPVPPPPLFTYRVAGRPGVGKDIVSAHVGFQAGFDVTWTWDAPTKTWKRMIFATTERTASGAEFTPKNVVIMFADYVGGDPNHGNEGAEAVLVGEGPLIVLSDGKAVNGTWSRPDKAKPARLLDGAGKTIALTPGQTWVELPEPGYSVELTPVTPTSSTSIP